MTFSGTSARSEEWTFVYIYKNDDQALSLVSDKNTKAENGFANVSIKSFTWMMKLAKGDELKLKSYMSLDASPLIPLTFTGELIHID